MARLPRSLVGALCLALLGCTDALEPPLSGPAPASGARAASSADAPEKDAPAAPSAQAPPRREARPDDGAPAEGPRSSADSDDASASGSGDDDDPPPYRILPPADFSTFAAASAPPPPLATVAAAAAAYAAHPSLLGKDMRGPNGLAIDAAGNLYEADFFRGTVTRVSPSGAVSPYAGGFKGPAGLAFDRAGNLLVAAYNGHTLEKIPPGGGSHATFASSGLKRPVWPAVDSQGSIYLADYSNNRIAKVSATGAVSTFASLSGVNAIAVDPQDTLWVCTWGGRVLRYDRQGKGTQLASGLPTACGIAWCASYLAVVTYGGERTRDGRLFLVDFAGKSYPVADHLDRASSVIFDRQLSVYTANCGDTALRKFALR